MTELIDLADAPQEYLTHSELHISGELKVSPDDFVVEEIPAYLPCNEGEHLFLWVEKQDVSAELLQQHIAKTLQIRRDDIGVAGLKDRRAVTRQWISVPASCQATIEEVNTDQIQVLDSQLHTNKLKIGHSRGNRFTIIVRNVAENSFDTAKKIAEEILKRGVPNYFGTQRFGIKGNTLRTGQELLNGEKKIEEIPRQRRKFLARLALSSVQSALFNAILNRRLQENITHNVQLGDVLQVIQSKGPFVSTEPDVDQVRFDSSEVMTTGPIFGPKMKMPADQMLEFEQSFLTHYGLTSEDFCKFRKLTPGARRPLLLWLEDLSVAEVDSGLQFQFDLPSGAYATVVLREFMKDVSNTKSSEHSK